MRRTVALSVALVFAAAFAQAPWAHAHLHDHDADHRQKHAGFGAVHGHGTDQLPPMLEWQDPGLETEIQSLGPGTAVRASTFTPDLTLTRTASPIVAPCAVSRRPLAPAPRAHGPPALQTLTPRAPPAFLLSA
jgi:hypothetical protein